MEHTDEFAKYKALGLKNKKTLEQLSEHIFNNRDIFNI